MSFDQVSGIQVLSYREVIIVRERLRKQQSKVVLTNGCFDILHRGHIEYLFNSAALGDALIVAVNSDSSVCQLKGPARPINPEFDRAFAVASLKCVHAAFIFRGPELTEEIRGLKPDIYTKAGDYTLETLNQNERMALERLGVNIQLMPFVSGLSTTSIISRMSRSE